MAAIRTNSTICTTVAEALQKAIATDMITITLSENEKIEVGV